jgi:hypothetical protein
VSGCKLAFSGCAGLLIGTGLLTYKTRKISIAKYLVFISKQTKGLE